MSNVEESFATLEDSKRDGNEAQEDVGSGGGNGEVSFDTKISSSMVQHCDKQEDGTPQGGIIEQTSEAAEHSNNSTLGLKGIFNEIKSEFVDIKSTDVSLEITESFKEEIWNKSVNLIMADTETSHQNSESDSVQFISAKFHSPVVEVSQRECCKAPDNAQTESLKVDPEVEDAAGFQDNMSSENLNLSSGNNMNNMSGSFVNRSVISVGNGSPDVDANLSKNSMAGDISMPFSTLVLTESLEEIPVVECNKNASIVNQNSSSDKNISGSFVRHSIISTGADSSGAEESLSSMAGDISMAAASLAETESLEVGLQVESNKNTSILNQPPSTHNIMKDLSDLVNHSTASGSVRSPEVDVSLSESSVAGDISMASTSLAGTESIEIDLKVEYVLESHKNTSVVDKHPSPDNDVNNPSDLVSHSINSTGVAIPAVEPSLRESSMAGDISLTTPTLAELELIEADLEVREPNKIASIVNQHASPDNSINNISGSFVNHSVGSPALELSLHKSSMVGDISLIAIALAETESIEVDPNDESSLEHHKNTSRNMSSENVHHSPDNNIPDLINRSITSAGVASSAIEASRINNSMAGDISIASASLVDPESIEADLKGESSFGSHRNKTQCSSLNNITNNISNSFFQSINSSVVDSPGIETSLGISSMAGDIIMAPATFSAMESQEVNVHLSRSFRNDSIVDTSCTTNKDISNPNDSLANCSITSTDSAIPAVSQNVQKSFTECLFEKINKSTSSLDETALLKINQDVGTLRSTSQSVIDIGGSTVQSPTINHTEIMEETCLTDLNPFKMEETCVTEQSDKGKASLDSPESLMNFSSAFVNHKKSRNSTVQLCNAYINDRNLNENTMNMDITVLGNVNGIHVNISDPNVSEESADNLEQSLDFTCKPEATLLLGEDTILMSQSLVGIDCGEELPVKAKSPCTEYEGDVEKEGNLTCMYGSLQEIDGTSGCAMDYSLSESQYSGLISDSEIKDSVPPLPSKNIFLQNVTSSFPSDRKQIITSHSNIISNETMDRLLDAEISSCEIEPSFMNITRKTNDIKNKLSESMNITMNLGRKLPTEEVTSMKENLYLIMDLLEEENNQFESYKKECEKEKIQLLAKIEDLQKQLVNEQKTVINENSKQNLQDPEDIEWFKKTFLLTDFDVQEVKKILHTLNSLNINTEGLMEDNERAIKPKKLLNILSLLLTKYNSFTGDYNEVKDIFEHDKAKLVGQVEQMQGDEKEQSCKFLNLESECENLKISLKGCTEHCKESEESNQRLKEDLRGRENEIIKLQNNITSIMEEIAVLEQTHLNKVSQVEKKYNELEVNFSTLQSSNDDLATKLQDKILAYNDISKSFELVTKEVDLLKESKSVLEKELENAKDLLGEWEVKYKTAETELQIMSNLEAKNTLLAELLDKVQAENLGLKSDLEKKNEELTNLGTKNEEADKELTLLRQNVENLLQSTVPKQELELISAKIEENLLALKHAEEQNNKEKEHSAKLLKDLGDKEFLCDELRGMKDALGRDNCSLRSDLAKTKADFEGLEDERVRFKTKCEEAEKELTKLHQLEVDYTALQELYQTSSETLQSTLAQKNAEYEELKIVNQSLENEITKLNTTSEDWRKAAEENESVIQGELNLLKNEVKEQRRLLDQKNLELDSLKAVHEHLGSDLVLSNLMLNSVFENNLILRTEFKQLLSQFGDINLKYKLVDMSRNQLKEKLDNMLTQLEDRCSQESETSSILHQQLAERDCALNEAREQVLNLKNDCNRLELMLESESTKLKSLNIEYSNLHDEHNQTQSKFKLLQEECDGYKSVIETMSCETTDLREKLASLESEHNSLKSMYENESVELESLRGKQAQLELDFSKASSNVDKFEKDCAKKDALNDDYKKEKDAMKSELLMINEDHSKLKILYSDLECKHSTISSELKLLEDSKEELNLKCEDLLKSLNKVESDYSKQLEINNNNHVEISRLQEELLKTNEMFSALKAEHAELSSKLESDVHLLELAEGEHNSLKNKYDETLSRLKQLEEEYSTKIESNEELNQEIIKLKGDIENMADRYSKLNKEYDDLTSEHEKECLRGKDLAKSIKELKDDYEKALSDGASLRAECENREKHKTDLEEKLKFLEAELDCEREKLSAAETDYKNLVLKHEAECSQVLSELNSKYEETKSSLEIIQKECLEKNDINEKFASELSLLKSQLLEANQKHEDLKQQYSGVTQELEAELSKSDGEHNSLKNKYDETLSRLKQLEEEYSTKIESNEELNQEIIKLKGDIENMADRYFTLNKQYDDLTSEHEKECLRGKDLAKSIKELKDDYEKALSDGASLRAECENIEKHKTDLEEKLKFLEAELDCEREKLSAAETDYENLVLKHEAECSQVLSELNAKYEETKSSLEIIQKECLEKNDINEKFASELSLLKSQLLEANQKQEDLKEQCSALTKELEAETFKSQTLKSMLCDLETKGFEESSSLKKLQDDFVAKVSENNILEEKCKALANDIVSLKSTLENSKEELEKMKEQNNSLNEKSAFVENELKTLLDEKQLHYDVENELKAKCEKTETDLLSKLQVIKDLEAQLIELNEKNKGAELEIEDLSKKYCDSTAKINDLSSSLNAVNNTMSLLQTDLQEKESEMAKAVLRIEKYKHFEDVIMSYRKDYPLLEAVFTLVQEEFSSSENKMLDSFFASIKSILKDMTDKNSELNQIKSSVLEKENEIDSLNKQISLLSSNLETLEKNSSEINNDLNEKYQILLESHNDIKEQYDSIVEKSSNLESENKDLKNDAAELTRALEEKNILLSDMEDIQSKLESVQAEKTNLISQLSKANIEAECLKTELVKIEETNREWKLNSERLIEEIENLKRDKDELQREKVEYSSKYESAKEEVARWEKESKAMRADKCKYERDYQTAVDSLRQAQEELCKMERNVEEKMSRFTFVLNEKQNFENKTLSLLKQNDELNSKIRELTIKSTEYEKSLSKLLELQSNYSFLSEEKVSLEKQLSDAEKLRRESMDLKAELAVKDSQINELRTDCKQLKTSCQKKSDELKVLLDNLRLLVPNCGSNSEILSALQGMLSRVNTLEEELKEEKTKCANLDEECELLSKDVEFKDTALGDLYKQHIDEVSALKDSLDQEERKCRACSEENKALKTTIEKLETEIVDLKTSEPAPCISCIELKKTLQKFKMDLFERESRVASLQQDLEQQSALKNKIKEYRKKIGSLEGELGSALNKIDEIKKRPFTDSAMQTDPTPLQLTGQGGIVHAMKIKEQEEKIQKIEKENMVLKKVCHNRLQTIKDLQAKVENTAQTPKKTQRNVLEEIQNN